MNDQLTIIEQREVIFYGDTLTAVRAASGQVYVPIRPICDLLGLDWSAQYRRIKRDPVLAAEATGVAITATPGGTQEMITLPLDYISGFLFGVNASRVKADLREKVIRYQRECYKVLAEAFQEGRLTADPDFDALLRRDSPAVQAYKTALAIVKLARQQVVLEARLDSHEQELSAHADRLEQLEAALGQPERAVTPEQASQISQAVKAVALALGQQTGRNEFGACYGELYRRFGITSYKMLPAHKFAAAMKFLTDWHQTLV